MSLLKKEILEMVERIMLKREMSDCQAELNKIKRALQKMGFAGADAVKCKDCLRNMNLRERVLGSG